MTSEEIYARALRLIERSKRLGSSERQAAMDEAFALIREAKRLRRQESRAEASEAKPRYRVWFHGESGFLYIDLPLARRVDALWAAEALASALAEEYDSYALWDGENQLLHSRTAHAVLSNRTAVEVSSHAQQVTLDAVELVANSNETLRRSRRLLAATAKMRRIVAEAGDGDTSEDSPEKAS